MADRHIKSPVLIVKLMSYSLLTALMIIAVAIVGSYVWTTHQFDQERQARIEQRVPACVLANSLIIREHGEELRKDTALYDATGCPEFLKELHESG